MTVLAIVTGSLFRAPEQRVAKSGKPFVSATLKVQNGDALQWWNIVAFRESVQADLLQLREVDGLGARGALRVETYEKAGETKLSLNMTVEAVLALRPPARERKAKAANPHVPETRSRQERLAGLWTAESGDPNDAIPF
jgi:hypothetical protein